MAAKYFFKKSNELESPTSNSLILDSTNERSTFHDDSNILESTDEVINDTNEFLSDDDDVPLVQLKKPSALMSSSEDEEESVTNIRETPDLDDAPQSHVPATDLISDDESDEDITNQVRRKPTILSSSEEELEPWRTPEQSLDEAAERSTPGNVSNEI